MGMRCEGLAWVVGNDVTTDDIAPAATASYMLDPVLGPGCLTPRLPDFSSRVRPGDLVVAGRNFGCGATREHAVAALQACGIGAVLAESFARPFRYCAIARGLPILVCRLPGVASGHRLRVDLVAGTVLNVTVQQTHDPEPLRPFAREVLSAGGLGAWVAQQVGVDATASQPSR